MASPGDDPFIRLVRLITATGNISFEDAPSNIKMASDAIQLKLESLSVSVTGALGASEARKVTSALLGSLVRLREIELENSRVLGQLLLTRKNAFGPSKQRMRDPKMK